MSHYRFGTNPVFDLLVRERRLLADGEAVPLGSRALDVLVVLVERAGQVVSRRELIERVWSELAVEENNLNVQVSMLRKTLGAHLIATIPGRGYCFTPRAVATTATATDDPYPRLKTNLPATLTRLIGREQAFAELETFVAEHRLVTLLGPGGVGKTLMAQHLLRQYETRFRHGVCFVELEALADEAAIPGAIACALRIQPAGGETLQGLVSAIEPLEIMVVLDNAEHLLEGASRMALTLHDAAPGLRLVVTSQAPLKLAAERVLRIEPLRVPTVYLPAEQALAHGAIALFVDRAQAADSRFALTDESAAAAIDLCRALDGLPLAIELAAWRAPVLGVRQLADSMHEPMKLLASQTQGKPKRLQTLRHALEWSFSLLHSHEQIVLRRMSVLVGSSDLDLIQKVACDPPGEGPIDEWAVVDCLSTLVERSLVAVTPGWNAGLRYRLLDTPRSFAKEQLSSANEQAWVGRRLAAAVADRFMRAYEERVNGLVTLGEWQERYLPDVDNGLAALAWMREHEQYDMAAMLLPGLMQATPREQSTLRAALVALSIDLADRVGTDIQALWMLLEAAQLITSANPERGQEVAREAAVRAERCASLAQDERWMYRALCQRATWLFMSARTKEGLASLAQARTMERQGWPAITHLQRWIAEIWWADRQGDGESMYQATLRLHTLSREAGLPVWYAGLAMVNGALAGGHATEAAQFGLDVVQQLQGTRHLGNLTETRVQLVGALLECGRLDEARVQSQAAWPLVAGFSRVDAWADYQALLAALEKRFADAAQLMGYANMICLRDHIERTYNEAAALTRTRSILLSHLGEMEMNRLARLGAGLMPADIPAIAFAALPDASPFLKR